MDVQILLPLEVITQRIVLLRGQKVLLDTDLAALYGVETKRLNEQIKRNAQRFPADFMFRLSAEETTGLNQSHIATGSRKHHDPRFPADFTSALKQDEQEPLRSQIATLKAGRGQHRKYLPYAFTEHGAIMAAMVLNSPRATEVSVYVVRAFVKLRELLATHRDLAQKIEELEQKAEVLAMRHDDFARNTRMQLKQVFEVIHELMGSPEPAKKRPIGFVTTGEKKPGKAKARC